MTGTDSFEVFLRQNRTYHREFLNWASIQDWLHEWSSGTITLVRYNVALTATTQLLADIALCKPPRSSLDSLKP